MILLKERLAAERSNMESDEAAKLALLEKQAEITKKKKAREFALRIKAAKNEYQP